MLKSFNFLIIFLVNIEIIHTNILYITFLKRECKPILTYLLIIGYVNVHCIKAIYKKKNSNNNNRAICLPFPLAGDITLCTFYFLFFFHKNGVI